MVTITLTQAQLDSIAAQTPVVTTPPVVTPPPVVTGAVTLTKWNSNPAPTFPAGKSPWVFEMPASGGSPGPLIPFHSAPGGGDALDVVSDATLGGHTRQVNVLNSGGSPYATTKKLFLKAAMGRDLVPAPGKTVGMETNNIGYALGGVFYPYTERTYTQVVKQLPTLYPGLDPDKCIAFGQSMGAWACGQWAIKHPDLFSVVLADRPRVGMGSIIIGEQATTGPAPVGMKTDTGQLVADYFDVAKLAADPTAKLVPFVFIIGQNDGFEAWPNVVKFLDACKAGRKWVACAWNAGNHGSGPPLDIIDNYGPQFTRGVGLPYFTNCSTDADWHTAPVGQINIGFDWQIIEDSATRFAFKVTNVKSDCAVDVEPMSDKFAAKVTPQHLTITKGVWQLVVFAVVTSPVDPPPVVTPPVVTPPLPAGMGVPVTKVAQRPQALIVAAKVPDGVGHMVWSGYSDGGRYLRGQYKPELTGTSAVIRIFAEQGFTIPPCTLQLTFDDKPVGAPVAAGATEALFTVDLTTIAEGDYFVSCTGVPAGWSVLDQPMYVRKGAQAVPQQFMKVVNASYDHVHHTPNLHIKAIVPAVYKPLEMALPVRAFPNFSHVPSIDQFVVRDIAVYRQDDVYRPNLSATGVWSQANRQNYFWSDVHSKLPLWPLLDGPRGRGTITCPTGLAHTLRTDGSDKVLFCDPWRVGTLIRGAVTTLVGYRHKEPPPFLNFEGYLASLVPTPELFGDWSAIPVAERGFQGLWDVIVDTRSIALDPSAPLIGGESPHVGNVRMWVCDYKRNRVCLLTFDGKDRAAPCKVTEFCKAVGPWNGVLVGNVLAISHRDGNKITGHDADTGAQLWSLDIVDPTGLRYQDGFYYCGSNTTRTVWKIDAATKAVTVHIANVGVYASVDVNAQFVGLAISDGTAGPRGSILTPTWSNAYGGFPMFYGVDGKRVDYFQPATGKSRVGPPYPGWDEAAPLYTSVAAMGNGRWTFGTVNEGLLQMSMADANDKPLPQAYFDGAVEYQEKGYIVTHGRKGMSLNGLPPPFGVSPNIDLYLTTNGHKP